MKLNKVFKSTVSLLTSAAVMIGAASAVFALNAPTVAEGYTRYEAEKAEFGGGTGFKLENQSGQSGGIVIDGQSYNVVGGFSTKAIDGLNYDFSNTTYVKFKINRTESGIVNIIVGYRSSQEVNFSQKCANIPIRCNVGSIKEAVIGSDDPNAIKKQAAVQVDMEAGENIVYVAGPIAGGGWINLDYIDVSNATTPGSVEPVETEVTLNNNPIIKSLYSADPSAHVWDTDGRLYLYPSHDRYPNRGCDRMDDFHIYSTSNMVDWRDEGEIFGAYDLEWGKPTADDGTFMWAPDAATKNGKYYFYYPHPADTAWKQWRVGVAVSDYPDRGFVDTGIPIAGIGGASMIDPCVFTDDDGKSYLYLGGGGNIVAAELNDDMMTLKNSPVPMVLENGSNFPDYHEGPFVFKRDGLYYFMYADINKINGASYNQQRYVVGNSPMGPWRVPASPADAVFLTPVKSDTSHGSIVKYKGEWYVFYHSRDLSTSGALRSVCVDKIVFNDDGTIKVVEQTDGSNLQIGAREAKPTNITKYQAENAVLGNTNGGNTPVIKTNSKADGGKAVGNLYETSSTITFNNVDGGNGGRVNINFAYSSPERGYIKLNVNGRDYSFINIMTTGGKSFFSGESNITVNMNRGTDNTIVLSECTVNLALDYMETTPFND